MVEILDKGWVLGGIIIIIIGALFLFYGNEKEEKIATVLGWVISVFGILVTIGAIKINLSNQNKDIDNVYEQRVATEEAEKKRIATEEAEKKRIAAEEAERKRIATEEAEKKRIAINPYGEGNGMLTVYTTDKHGGKTSIYIESKLIGVLTNYYSSGCPDCGTDGPSAVSHVLKAGYHNVTAEDGEGKWAFSVHIKEGKCELVHLAGR